ncbi:MAG: hypothetical protein ACK421_07655 [Pseudanabaenaceae cyanobacterium]
MFSSYGQDAFGFSVSFGVPFFLLQYPLPSFLITQVNNGSVGLLSLFRSVKLGVLSSLGVGAGTGVGVGTGVGTGVGVGLGAGLLLFFLSSIGSYF